MKWSCVSISLLQNGIWKKNTQQQHITIGNVSFEWYGRELFFWFQVHMMFRYRLFVSLFSIDILCASKREIYCILQHMTLCTKEILFQNNNAAGRPKNIPSFKVKTSGERTQLKMNRSLVYVILLFITASTCAPELAFQWKHSICIAPSVCIRRLSLTLPFYVMNIY